ncbi:SixA phosphatase family protein [Pengzhenrongella sp.]|jgi:phosphohistidine phosphatase|uniref:SixA phosphatase family protein n=1 Tax=Pengzhenrongella sp. TaxID=2888820 RepID=UPI002F92F541
MTPEMDRTRRLVLLRHAKAEHGGQADELRPLALAGRRQCFKVGAALSRLDLVPELVLCSSAVRARQTWDLVRGGLGDVEPEVLVTDALYEAGVRQVLGQVHDVDERIRTVLVVGHEPTISATASALAGDGSVEDAVTHVFNGLSTGTFVVLELDGTWGDLAVGTARLTEVVSPKD